MKVSTFVIPTLLSCVLGCELETADETQLRLAPGEDEAEAEAEAESESGPDLGVGDTNEDTSDSDTTESETGEDDEPTALRIVLGGDGSQFVNGTLNGFAGGNFDGLLVSIYIDPVSSHYEWLRFHGGDKNEDIRDLDIDANGRICASGWTNSLNMPVTVNAPQPAYGGGTRDLYVGCWSAQGSLLYSTYLGGKLAELNDTALTLSADGTPVVTGSTTSINLATTATAVQAAAPAGANGLVFDYGPTGMINWGSYLGGAGTDSVGLHNDLGPNDQIWMIGTTDSADFPVTDLSILKGGLDSVVARISANGATLELGTLLGGSAGDYGKAIVALPDGTAITCGNTYSEDFPVTVGAAQTTHGSQQQEPNYDVVLTHLASDGSVIAATYLGGEGFDACSFVDVDGEGNVYVAGWTDDVLDFPLTTNASVFGAFNPNSQVGFLAKLDPDLEVLEYAVRTRSARGMDVLDDGRVVLLAPENPGLSLTPNAINGQSGNALIVFAADGVTPEYAGYVMGENMGVRVLHATEVDLL